MDAVKCLLERRSCRSYKKDQITDAELKIILDAGLNAPSGMNRQDTKIIVVQDPAKVAKLSKMNADVMGAAHDPFYGAPTVTVIVAPGETRNNIKDGSLVIGAMQSAAYAIGVGSCWINRAEEMLKTEEGEAVLAELGLEGYVGVGCCILGYVETALPEKEIKEGRIVKY